MEYSLKICCRRSKSATVFGKGDGHRKEVLIECILGAYGSMTAGSVLTHEEDGTNAALMTNDK